MVYILFRQRAEKKNRNRINTINERLQTEEEMIDNIQEMQKSGVQKISMLNLKKLVEEFRNARVGKAWHRKRDRGSQEKPGTIDKENEMLQYVSQLRSPDLSSVFSSFIGKCHCKIDNIYKIGWCIILFIYYYR